MKSVLLVRVSSAVDKDVAHPQFFDPCYPLKYIQAGLRNYPGLQVNILDCWVRRMDPTELTAYVNHLQPDLTLVSASSFDVHIADQFTAGLKQNGKP